MKCRRDELNNLVIGSFGPLRGQWPIWQRHKNSTNRYLRKQKRRICNQLLPLLIAVKVCGYNG